MSDGDTEGDRRERGGGGEERGEGRETERERGERGGGVRKRERKIQRGVAQSVWQH